MRCADCDGAPTCPLLHDDLWDRLWLSVSPKAPRRCTCALWDKESVHKARGRRVDHDGSPHWQACDLIKPRRPLLCLECAEQRLGRQIGLLDLKPCLGNYHAFVAVVRLAELVVSRASVKTDASRDEVAYALVGLPPPARSIDQLIADSSIGRGLARIAAGDLEGELKQHERCARGAKRGGRHLWSPIPGDSPDWTEVIRLGCVEYCECGAAR